MAVNVTVVSDPANQPNGTITIAKDTLTGVEVWRSYGPPDPGVVNAGTIRANVQTNLATLQQWLVNNPNGAVLTAAQTKVLANILIGVSKLLLADTATTTGT